jgi:hypothetical protein
LATSQNDNEPHLTITLLVLPGKNMRRIESARIGFRIFIIGSITAFSGFAPGHNQANVHLRDSTPLSSNSLAAAESWRLYDPDPNHVWNRLYRSLFGRMGRDGREYGYDELEPLLWSQTKYLLINPANQQAITILDKFLSTHAERKIRDPLKRAVLQRDLWAIFDWTAGLPTDTPEKLNLQIRLVQVMKRLALSPDEIATLPTTYQQAVTSKAFATAYDLNKREQAFLPPDLLDPKGSWVSLGSREGLPVASAHVDGFSGRPVFLVFMHLPEGRDATLKYLQKLSEVPKRKLWIPDPGPPDVPARVRGNPNVPQFPTGTELALVREMVLIDSQGNFRPTNIIESIQIRIHRIVPSEIPQTFFSGANGARAEMDTFEFKLSRSRLFAGESGGLRPVLPGETEFALFLSHGIDWESRVSLTACSSCHLGPGIYSVRSRGGDIVPASDSNQEANETKSWKSRRYDWGLLQGMRRSQPGTVAPMAP